MGNHNNKMSAKRKTQTAIIMLYCALITACVVAVLVFAYRPDKNALGALGSVCMDVISMFFLLILIISFLFTEEKFSKTTKLFMGLMLGTMNGLFFDFLTWSLDGTLAFGKFNFAFVLISLCTAPVLVFIFVIYLSTYMQELHNLTSIKKSARICAICNVAAFVVTLTFGLTGMAFVFVDGHYEIGALYDVITVIPVLTLLYIVGYLIYHVKTIGRHDVIAVAAYTFTMILGALIESEYDIGTTYVSVTIADVFIFLMLQNKLIDRVKRQRELLEEKNTSQFNTLESMAGIYSYINNVNLEERIASRFDIFDSVLDQLDLEADPHTSLNKKLFDGIDADQKEAFWAYTDLSTLSIRMKGEKLITAEFHHREDGWLRAHYIRVGEAVDEPIKRVIYAIQNIDEEKKNVEKWIYKSNTDELTGFYNRHAYEDEIALLESGKIKDKFVYVSIDVNSLKQTNDTLGHEAGDELIIGASDCLRQCFGAYGKLYRTGGDEFVALIFADESQLEEIKMDIEDVTANWVGEHNQHLAMSIGYMTQREAEKEGLNLHQMAVIADKRMYEDKTRYYQRKGIDRRGQRDAHVALCDLYIKILKVNITDDTYQIINVNDDEKNSEKGFADSITKWFHDFGTSGQVHPEDLDEYLMKTNVDSISEYFKENTAPLHIFYRRRRDDDFVRVMMELIRAHDYSDERQSLYLYVKEIE